jgi:hypothetical protein
MLFVAEEPDQASCARMAFCGPHDPTEAYFDEMWRVAEFVRNPFKNNVFDRQWLSDALKRLEP